MKEFKRIMGSIRGTRHSIELVKRVKGMPGFAPEYRDYVVGEVVFNFPHNEECVYLQLEDNVPILEKEDVKHILEIMNRKFNKKDWDNLPDNKE